MIPSSVAASQKNFRQSAVFSIIFYSIFVHFVNNIFAIGVKRITRSGAVSAEVGFIVTAIEVFLAYIVVSSLIASAKDGIAFADSAKEHICLAFII